MDYQSTKTVFGAMPAGDLRAEIGCMTRAHATLENQRSDAIARVRKFRRDALAGDNRAAAMEGGAALDVDTLKSQIDDLVVRRWLAIQVSEGTQDV